MTKRVAISYPEIFESVKQYFADRDVEIFLTDKNEPNSDYDLIVVYDDYDFILSQGNVINIHPSLLPAYNEKDAVIKAFNDGAKVSGITIHSKDRIIAQYPVLIGVETHIDEFMNEMLEVEKKLVPPVIDALLNDRVFDFSYLFSNPCHKNGCNGCGGCH